MVEEAVDAEGTSPRSTILVTSARMTTALPIAGMNESNMAPDIASPDEDKMPPSTKEASSGGGKDLVKSSSLVEVEDTSPETKETKSVEGKKSVEEDEQRISPPTPSPHEYPSNLQATYQTLTPQQGSYYYPQLQQPGMGSEPPSPAGPHAAYDVGSFLQQRTGGFTAVPTAGSSFLGAAGSATTTPLSPPRTSVASVSMAASIPPSSPLFPRVSSGGGLDASGRGPQLPYVLSPQIGGSSGSANMYQAYPSNGVGSQSSDDGVTSWSERNQSQNSYPSPQVGAGMQMPYGMPLGRSTRAYSMEETMLPPSMLDPQDQANPAYSPYGGSQASQGATTLFAQQSSWGYGGPPDMYSAPNSPLQPRPTAHMPMYGNMMGGGGGGGGGMRSPMAPYGQYPFPASSPGPPIQTTASNKGPDGANLFIFHIPNHFTNLDMYQLFTPYGNLLSVRIMVEKDTGRSRGFGFVSYDCPESAALAIKELNGFPIGNKRLKVQHKQIRRNELMEERSSPQDHFGGSQNFSSSLPPSGSNANQTLWFESTHSTTAPGDGSSTAAPPDQPHTIPPDDGAGDLNNSPGGDILSGGANVGGGINEDASPLTTMGQMQSALPDITAKGSPE